MARQSLSSAAVAVSAAAALAVAMGVGRFAFTPMLPLMIRDGALDASTSPWLAAVNYLTYLLGAVSAARLPLTPANLVRLSLLGIAAVTALMGVTGALTIWLLLRGLAGLLSGWALVGTSTWALGELARLNRPRLAAAVYAGVGVGLALAGLFCFLAARPGVSAADMWLELGALTLIVLVAPLVLMRDGPTATHPAAGDVHPATDDRSLLLMTICYGIFGFGYILPATFLPAMARQVVDDPAVFGLVWPLFGLAAIVSTLAAGTGPVQAHRLPAWAICHVLMGAGALLPVVLPTRSGLAVSALLVGGTFMVVTMLGMQEARLRAARGRAGEALGRMTGAFAIGQLAGPIAVTFLPADSSGLDLGLGAAGLALIATAPVLWQLPRDHRRAG